MVTPAEIPFQQVIDSLLDEKTIFHPRFLYRLSDLNEAESALLERNWMMIALHRRKTLMEDIEEIGDSDLVLNFEGVGQIALKDEDPQVRLLAVRVLAEYEAPRFIPDFRQMAKQDEEEEVRAAAAFALGPFVYLGELEQLPEQSARQIEDDLLEVVLGEDTPLVRRRALEALSFSGREEVNPIIEWAFTSGDLGWLETALFAMGRSANEDWTSQVLSMLDHAKPAIRTEAVSAAGELEIHEAVSKLIDLLRDDHDDVRFAAIWALSQIGGEGVREILEEMLDDVNDEEEADMIEMALDNLAFTEDLQPFSLFSFPESEEEGEELDGFFDDDLYDSEDDEDIEA